MFVYSDNLFDEEVQLLRYYSWFYRVCSQLLLTRFWPNFKKVNFLEHLEEIQSVMVTFVQATFVLETYQEYHGWPDFDFKGVPNIFRPKCFYIQKFIDQTFFESKIFWDQNNFSPNIFSNPKFFGRDPKLFRNSNVVWTHNFFSDQILKHAGSFLGYILWCRHWLHYHLFF